MKKLVYFFGIFALIAGLVTSCSKDDDDEGKGEGEGNTVVQKKLKRAAWGGDIYDLTYGPDNRCSSIMFFYEDIVQRYNLYKYEGEKWIEEKYEADSSIYSTNTITFNSLGYLESENEVGVDGDASTTTYTYNNQGHLISMSYTSSRGQNSSYSYSINYEWKNGNVTKMAMVSIDESVEDKEVYYLEYTNDKHATPIENKVGYTILNIDDNFEPQYLKAGVTLKNLPVHIKFEEDGKKQEYDILWDLDRDGYPLRMKVDMEYRNDFVYTWE